MALNEHGARLDRNGYAPSIFDTDPGVCFMCPRQGETARHEIFYGAMRQKSKRFGLWIHACPFCHEEIHKNQREDEALKQFAQKAAMEHYGWGLYDWDREFYKSYL